VGHSIQTIKKQALTLRNGEKKRNQSQAEESQKGWPKKIRFLWNKEKGILGINSYTGHWETEE